VRVAGASVAYRFAVMVNSMVRQNPYGPPSTWSVLGATWVTGLSIGPDDGVLFPTAGGGLVWLVGNGDMAQLRATGGPYGDPGPPPPALETPGLSRTREDDPASVQVTGKPSHG